MRARLLVLSLFLFGAVLLHAQGGAPYDLIIRNARIIDGTASPWYRGEIAVRGDTIAQIAPRIDGKAAREIDARGLVVAPGFIDIHTHARRGIFEVPTADNYVRQGVTTLIEGPDGSSPIPLAPFLAKVQAHAHHAELRDVHRPGLGAQRGDGRGRSAGDARRARQDARARHAGHGRRRVRPELGAVLRARRVHADRRSDRARTGRRADGRHLHLAHARRGQGPDRQRARDDRHRREGRPADADHASQGGRQEVLGRLGRDAAHGRRGARARRRRDDRSVSLHRVGDEHRRGAAAGVGAGGRPRVDAEAAEGSGDAREDQGRERRHHPRRARRRRSEERVGVGVPVRSEARRPEPRADHAGPRPRGDARERRRNRDVDRRAGRLRRHLPRHRRRGPRSASSSIRRR